MQVLYDYMARDVDPARIVLTRKDTVIRFSDTPFLLRLQQDELLGKVIPPILCVMDLACTYHGGNDRRSMHPCPIMSRRSVLMLSFVPTLTARVRAC